MVQLDHSVVLLTNKQTKENLDYGDDHTTLKIYLKSLNSSICQEYSFPQ